MKGIFRQRKFSHHKSIVVGYFLEKFAVKVIKSMYLYQLQSIQKAILEHWCKRHPLIMAIRCIP